MLTFLYICKFILTSGKKIPSDRIAFYSERSSIGSRAQAIQYRNNNSNFGNNLYWLKNVRGFRHYK